MGAVIWATAFLLIIAALHPILGGDEPMPEPAPCHYCNEMTAAYQTRAAGWLAFSCGLHLAFAIRDVRAASGVRPETDVLLEATL